MNKVLLEHKKISLKKSGSSSEVILGQQQSCCCAPCEHCLGGTWGNRYNVVFSGVQFACKTIILDPDYDIQSHVRFFWPNNSNSFELEAASECAFHLNMDYIVAARGYDPPERCNAQIYDDLIGYFRLGFGFGQTELVLSVNYIYTPGVHLARIFHATIPITPKIDCAGPFVFENQFTQAEAEDLYDYNNNDIFAWGGIGTVSRA